MKGNESMTRQLVEKLIVGCCTTYQAPNPSALIPSVTHCIMESETNWKNLVLLGDFLTIRSREYSDLYACSFKKQSTRKPSLITAKRSDSERGDSWRGLPKGQFFMNVASPEVTRVDKGQMSEIT